MTAFCLYKYVELYRSCIGYYCCQYTSHTLSAGIRHPRENLGDAEKALLEVGVDYAGTLRSLPALVILPYRIFKELDILNIYNISINKYL